MATSHTAHPAIEAWDGPYGLPRYDAFSDADLEEAVMAGFAADEAEHEAIAAQADDPTFENTIEAMEKTGRLLSRAAMLFFQKAANHTNDTVQAAERRLSPLFARHSATIARNKPLFARIDAMWKRRESLGLTGEQMEVLRRHHRRFVLSGAGLEGAQQARLFEINERLATLGTTFGQNVLKDEADWAMVLDDEADLAGLPKALRSAMAAAAEERGHDGKHAVTLSRSIIDPFLTFSTRTDLRRKAHDAWTARGRNGGETDNSEVIAETLRLRAEKARLLGYDSFAALKLENTMAKTPAAVNDLLDTVWKAARDKAATEARDIEALMRAEGNNGDLTAADWRHYAEKIRADRFDYRDEDIKPFMRLDAMIDAAFDVANRLFGLSFKERTGVALHHPDARLWEVHAEDGNLKALFIGDYFARSSKRSGAWMSAIQIQSDLLGQIPFITNTMNFAKPPAGQDAFLSFDDARTLFHEFGHALHGMLSSVTYPSVAGTAVSRDFVELPSQLYEHWLTVPDVLSRFARHNETGEPMPPALLSKVLKAQTFNSGFQTIEYLGSAIVDMALHAQDTAPEDPLAFEAKVLADLDMPSAIGMRHQSPHFLHIFSGEGYAAGYYAYLWSEVLDADAFKAFDEAGDPFDAATAERLRTNIYASGGSKEPEAAYTGFRGQLPTPEAMLEGRDLI